ALRLPRAPACASPTPSSSATARTRSWWARTCGCAPTSTSPVSIRARWTYRRWSAGWATPTTCRTRCTCRWMRSNGACSRRGCACRTRVRSATRCACCRGTTCSTVPPNWARSSWPDARSLPWMRAGTCDETRPGPHVASAHASATMCTVNAAHENTRDGGPDNLEDLMIHTSGVEVRRGGNKLLSDLDWSVELDERWVILGPNGAGKTTLLKLAAAELHPTSGTVHILGERLGRTDVFELRTRIGFSSAAVNARVPGDEKVRDVVVSAGYAVMGRWRERYDELDTERADELLAALGIAHLATREYGTLSEGERKRTLIARAQMTDPELLLLDEPAAGLDLGGREDLVARLSGLALDPDAPAMVLVTHHVEEIPPGFTHALLLAEGRVVAGGLLDDVLTAENLSATFGQDLVLERSGDRYFARRR